MKELLDLYWTFVKIGCVTFGGGYAMLPVLERELVDKRGWTTLDELQDYFSIGQCTPGIIALNVSTFIGEKRAKIRGALVCTTGFLTGPVVIILIIAMFVSNFAHIPAVQHAFAGIRACVCILILNAVLKLRKSSIIDLPTAILFALVFAASAAFGLSPALLVVTCGLIGLGLSRFRNEHPQTSGDNPTAPTEVAHASGEQSASDPSQTSADAQNENISQVSSDSQATK